MSFHLPSISALLANAPPIQQPSPPTSSSSPLPPPPIPFPSILPFPDHVPGHHQPPPPPPQPRRKYACQYQGCGKSFTTSGHLARHNRIHTGERNYACLLPGCPSRFSRQDNMMQHYRTHLANSSTSHAALLASTQAKPRRRAEQLKTPQMNQGKPPMEQRSNGTKWTPPLSPPPLETTPVHGPKQGRYHPYQEPVSAGCACCPPPPSPHGHLPPYHPGYGFPLRPHMPPPYNGYIPLPPPTYHRGYSAHIKPFDSLPSDKAEIVEVLTQGQVDSDHSFKPST